MQLPIRAQLSVAFDGFMLLGSVRQAWTSVVRLVLLPTNALAGWGVAGNPAGHAASSHCAGATQPIRHPGAAAAAGLGTQATRRPLWLEAMPFRTLAWVPASAGMTEMGQPGRVRSPLRMPS